jgi:hypothetical protein
MYDNNQMMNYGILAMQIAMNRVYLATKNISIDGGFEFIYPAIPQHVDLDELIKFQEIGFWVLCFTVTILCLTLYPKLVEEKLGILVRGSISVENPNYLIFF